MNRYANYTNFGNNQNPPQSGNNDPLTYCLVDTMDKNFQHGPMGPLYGPRSQKCQLYMAQRCADNWDGFCEYYYQHNNTNSQWPDSQLWPNTVQPRYWAGSLNNVPLSTGEQLLQNAGERRFCTYRNCSPRCEPFDPMNPNSPSVIYYDDPYGYGENCVPECRVDPKTIDQDILMDRMLDNPKASATTLINICNTSKREGIDLSGTKIGAFCNRYLANIQALNSGGRRTT